MPPRDATALLAAIEALLNRSSVTYSKGVNITRESTFAVYVNEGVWQDFESAARQAIAAYREADR